MTVSEIASNALSAGTADFAKEYQAVEGMARIPLDVRSYRACEAAAEHYLDRGDFDVSACNVAGILITRLARKGWGWEKAILIAEIAITMAKRDGKHPKALEYLPRAIESIKESRGLLPEIDHRAIPAIIEDDYHEELQGLYENAAHGDFTWPMQPLTDEALSAVFHIVNREYAWVLKPQAA